MTTFSYTFTRDDGTEVECEYEDRLNGSSGSYFDPPEPSDRETTGPIDRTIGLTDAEYERLDAEIQALPENDPPDDYDY